MTPYEFGQLVGATEKDAGMADAMKNYAAKTLIPGVKNLVTKGVEKATPVIAGATRGARGAAASVRRQMPISARNAVKNTGAAIGNKVTDAAKLVGSVGQVAQNATRNSLNYADDAARYAMSGPNRAAATGGKIGDRIVRPVQTEAGRMFGSSPVGDKLNPLNLATGGATMYGGARATGLVGGGGDSEPTQANIDNQQIANQAMQMQHGEANPNAAGNGGGMMGMWNSLPTEARYAIGAGVPLALAGAFMGGRGNPGLGGAMGALGLGAAGLGAAGAGMFGDGPRRFVGQGANALYGAMGGGGDPRSQLGALGQLSPQFGGTMLMGRDPNMSGAQAEQMHNFLTHNRGIIEQLMPQLQANSTNGFKQGSAHNFGEKVARCWKGYEPVPGKKPYSDDSCRPAGSKKKKNNEKKAVSSAARGKTDMTLEPSSRGTKKLIGDKQRETNSPVPIDAKNNEQQHEKVAVPLGAIVRGAGRLAVRGARGLASGVGTAAQSYGGASQKVMSGVGNVAQRAGTEAHVDGIRAMARGAKNFSNATTMTGRLGGAAQTGYGALMRGAGTVNQAVGAGANMLAKNPLAAGAATAAGLYGAANTSVAQPYVNHAQQFGRNMYNQASNDISKGVNNVMAVPRAAATGVSNAVSSAGNLVGSAFNTAGNAAADAGKSVGNAFNTAGTALGDAAGTAYGTARNSVVNTANDARRGMNNAVQTARSYVPSVRNPFHYDQPPGMPSGPQM